MNLGNRSTADIQDYVATQRKIIAEAEEARRNLRFALSFIGEMTEARPMATCQDLIEEGLWCRNFCCERCHELAAEQGDQVALVQATIENWRRPALLCCHATILLDPRHMPSHEMEYPE
jgi:hypothetical protein